MTVLRSRRAIFGLGQKKHKVDRDLRHMEQEILALKAKIDKMMPVLPAGERDIVFTWTLSQMVALFVAEEDKGKVFKTVAGFLALRKA